jgi:hypothetical protein
MTVTCVECTILQRRPQRIIFLYNILLGPQSLLFFLLPIFLRNHCLQTEPLRRGGEYAELAKYPSHPIGRLGADRYPISQSIRLETDFLNPRARRDGVVGPDLHSLRGQKQRCDIFFHTSRIRKKGKGDVVCGMNIYRYAAHEEEGSQSAGRGIILTISRNLPSRGARASAATIR